ncbi:hypothetical protein KY285_033327 [Solanum tuberosum]|nr:hypothetical protein KY285_033327 [Solanum tuberosum]
MNQAEESKLSKPHACSMHSISSTRPYKSYAQINTDFNHQRLLESRGPNSLVSLPSFRFESIPDGLPPSNEDSTQDSPSLCEASKKSCLVPFRDLVTRLNNNSNFPSISCIVSDAAMSFTQQVSQELSVPNVGLWTSSACSLLAFTQYPKLVEQGYSPLKDESYLDTIIDWIPGMKGIRLKNLPSMIRARVDDPNYIIIKFVMEEIMDKIPKFSALILNTFDTLDVGMYATTSLDGTRSSAQLQNRK